MKIEKRAGLAAFLAAVFSISASAQEPADAADTDIVEVVVTGSRVARSGYEQPTPITILGLEQMQADAPHNVADLVNQLPSVVGSSTPQNSNFAFSSGGAGINGISLRGLGRSRTLVLLDGRRSPGAASDGAVDINTIPQPLIKRIEIVTGGASAAYGSDALSGVVNFILDKDYVGVKAEASGGITTYGDGGTSKFSLTGGTEFSDGRGHILASAEVNSREGIFGNPRDWGDTGAYTMINPNYDGINGEPEWLLLTEIGVSNALPGGLITDTALRGTAFGVGGTPYQFNYGPLVRDPAMQGGDWRTSFVGDLSTLDPVHDRWSMFTHLSYELTDNLEGYLEYSFTDSQNRSVCCPQFNAGNIAIAADNAFIPPTVAAQVAALGLAGFTLGSMNGDLPNPRTDYARRTHRYSVGALGTFESFGSEWSWEAYAQRGVTKTNENGFSSARANFGLAIDAVLDPASGAIVCRSTLTDPTNGCVAWNTMGIGVNSPAAINYVYDNPIGAYRLQEFTQDVYAVSVQGAPFSIWAGDVSVALGLEHRKEEIDGVNDDLSDVRGWFLGNYLPTIGDYTVSEGFIESVVPIMEDTFDLNAAVRLTDYSTSGNVTTWKIGATIDLIEDVRIRITRSRDIRAPSLRELFEGGLSQTNSVSDPFNNGDPVAFLGLLTGNLDLEPEEADTLGVGVIFSPRFLPGLRASIDYFDIEITGAIGTVSVQNIVDRCFLGAQNFCDAITRGDSPLGTNVIIKVERSPFNFERLNVEGVDIEATYSFAGLGGDFTLRGLATHYRKFVSDNGIDPPSNSAGQNGDGVLGSDPPDWSYRASATYSTERFTTTLTARGISDGVYNNDFIECTSGCPVSNSTNRTVNNNHINGAVYFDLSAAYDIPFGNDSNLELFATIRNIANTDPEVVHQGPGIVAMLSPPTNLSSYDIFGTVFRAGVRVDF